MLHDSGARFVISHRSLWPRLANLGGVAMLDIDTIEERHEGAAPSASEAVRDRLAFVIYTSGSIGRPKGVAIEEHAVLNRLRWMWQARPFQTSEISCQRALVGFVDSI